MTNEDFKRCTEECGYIYIDEGDEVYAVNDKRDGVWIAEFNEPKQKLKCCTLQMAYLLGLSIIVVKDKVLKSDKIKPKEKK